MREDFTYPSSDGKNMIHGIRWTPEDKPIAVLQIVHGMVEFIARYEEFAEYLTRQGFAVVGEDHLGHGESAMSEEDLGYFGKGGNGFLMEDIHQLRKMTTEQWPDIPYFMLGHSMGSFLLRQYLVEGEKAPYAEGLSGAIVMGTGWQPDIALKLGTTLSGFAEMFRGDRHRSRLIEKMALGSNNRKIKNPRTKDDWLSKDTDVVDAYEENPLCQFHFTVNAYYNMFKGIRKCQDRQLMKRLPEKFPMLFISGAEDPVGNYGDGVRKAYMVYLENSAADVHIKLYEEDRHEILNETNREDVYNYLLTWLKNRML